MIIYLNADFEPVEKAQATMAKVIPDDGSSPYFIRVNEKEEPTKSES